MKQFLKDCFTARDGKTYDIGRFLWAISVLTFLMLNSCDLLINHHFSSIDFGTGLGLVLAGGGAALGLKKKTEPE